MGDPGSCLVAHGVAELRLLLLNPNGAKENRRLGRARPAKRLVVRRRSTRQRWITWPLVLRIGVGSLLVCQPTRAGAPPTSLGAKPHSVDSRCDTRPVHVRCFAIRATSRGQSARPPADLGGARASRARRRRRSAGAGFHRSQHAAGERGLDRDHHQDTVDRGHPHLAPGGRHRRRCGIRQAQTVSQSKATRCPRSALASSGSVRADASVSARRSHLRFKTDLAEAHPRAARARTPKTLSPPLRAQHRNGCRAVRQETATNGTCCSRSSVPGVERTPPS